MPDSDFSHKVLRLLNRKQQGEKNRLDLMVIKWGSAKIPVLENRRSFFDEKTNEWRFRKLAGLGVEELNIIRDNMNEIEQLLKPDN